MYIYVCSLQNSVIPIVKQHYESSQKTTIFFNNAKMKVEEF